MDLQRIGKGYGLQGEGKNGSAWIGKKITGKAQIHWACRCDNIMPRTTYVNVTDQPLTR